MFSYFDSRHRPHIFQMPNLFAGHRNSNKKLVKMKVELTMNILHFLMLDRTYVRVTIYLKKNRNINI